MIDSMVNTKGHSVRMILNNWGVRRERERLGRFLLLEHDEERTVVDNCVWHRAWKTHFGSVRTYGLSHGQNSAQFKEKKYFKSYSNRARRTSMKNRLNYMNHNELIPSFFLYLWQLNRNNE